MSETGDQKWWEELIEKTAELGLSLLQRNMSASGGGETAPAGSSPSGMTKYLPYLFGGAALIGVVLLMKNR